MGLPCGPIQTGILQVIWHDARTFAKYIFTSRIVCSENAVSIPSHLCYMLLLVFCGLSVNQGSQFEILNARESLEKSHTMVYVQP